MLGINECLIGGNLTKDPEIRFMPNGTKVATCTIACNKRYKQQDGGVKEKVLYIDAIAFGAQAEFCEKYLKKASPALFLGELDERTWDKDGQKRKKMELRVRQYGGVRLLPTAQRTDGADISVTDVPPEEATDLETF